ncbi:MAG: hypothetical protein OEZ06_24255 [Myxococcales bacterium]|nr:hypothetical protein [Myxococcales bacterium]
MAKKRRAAAAVKEEIELPPQLPETREGLERAIMLLGYRTQNELTPKVQAELEALLGAYPSAETAVHWKRELKSLRDEY